MPKPPKTLTNALTERGFEIVAGEKRKNDLGWLFYANCGDTTVLITAVPVTGKWAVEVCVHDSLFEIPDARLP